MNPALNLEECRSFVEQIAREVFDGTGMDVDVRLYKEPGHKVEVTVGMRTGVVHGPHVEPCTRIEDERNMGKPHLLKARLKAWRDSGFASEDT